MKVLSNMTDFHASLWADSSQNTVCPWQLYGLSLKLIYKTRFY